MSNFFFWWSHLYVPMYIKHIHGEFAISTCLTFARIEPYADSIFLFFRFSLDASNDRIRNLTERHIKRYVVILLHHVIWEANFRSQNAVVSKAPISGISYIWSCVIISYILHNSSLLGFVPKSGSTAIVLPFVCMCVCPWNQLAPPHFGRSQWKRRIHLLSHGTNYIYVGYYGWRIKPSLNYY